MRLSDLTPESVADDVVRQVQEYVITLAMRVELTAQPPQWECQSLRFAARHLAAYAIHGAELDAPAIEYVQSVAEVMYIRPADQGTYETEDFSEDASTSWGLVIRAALARDKLAAGDDLGTAELACLASLSTSSVVQLVRSGEIPTRKARDDDRPGRPAALITAAAARRWLSGRGVPGY